MPSECMSSACLLERPVNVLLAIRGERLVDATGLWRKGKVVRVDVMRREKNYGESYGENRSGEWEFATYESTGALRTTVEGMSCAKCHQTATEARDYVFRGRFPPLAKN